MTDNDKVILLVEDNPDDEALTLRALMKNNIMNKVVVARDGVEALDYLFGTGAYAGPGARDYETTWSMITAVVSLPVELAPNFHFFKRFSRHC